MVNVASSLGVREPNEIVHLRSRSNKQRRRFRRKPRQECDRDIDNLIWRQSQRRSWQATDLYLPRQQSTILLVAVVQATEGDIGKCGCGLLKGRSNGMNNNRLTRMLLRSKCGGGVENKTRNESGSWKRKPRLTYDVGQLELTVRVHTRWSIFKSFHPKRNPKRYVLRSRARDCQRR